MNYWFYQNHWIQEKFLSILGKNLNFSRNIWFRQLCYLLNNNFCTKIQEKQFYVLFWEEIHFSCRAVMLPQTSSTSSTAHLVQMIKCHQCLHKYAKSPCVNLQCSSIKWTLNAEFSIRCSILRNPNHYKLKNHKQPLLFLTMPSIKEPKCEWIPEWFQSRLSQF